MRQSPEEAGGTAAGEATPRRHRGKGPGYGQKPPSRGCDAAENLTRVVSACAGRGVRLCPLNCAQGPASRSSTSTARPQGPGAVAHPCSAQPAEPHGVRCRGSAWPDVASPAAHTGKAPDSGSETGRPSVTAVRSGSKYSPPPRDNRAHGACRMCCGQVVGAGSSLAIWVLAHGSERVPPASPPVRGGVPAVMAVAPGIRTWHLRRGLSRGRSIASLTDGPTAARKYSG